MHKQSKHSSQRKQRAQHKFDVAIAWNWEFDRDFVSQINNTCLKCDLKPYLIHPLNLDETLQLVKKQQLEFAYFFDRASDTDPRFLELVRLLHKNGTTFVNHPEKIKWVDDKALIHMEFILNKIPVPQTFIYYPTDEREVVMDKIKQIGVPFVVKPAHSVNSGAFEVLVNASSVEDIFKWHLKHKDFIFLLQRQVTPHIMDERPAWFRVFYVLGKVIPCWWNPSTHTYETVTAGQIRKFRLTPLYNLTKKIGRIYKLGFFSTEIAMEKGRRFIVVDYINDQCDMRKKSQFSDGVCDETVDLIINEILNNFQKSQKT